MKAAVVTVLCAISLAIGAGVASASPATSQAGFRRLSEVASAALGERHFACLASVWQGPNGERTFVSGERSVRVGFDLLITARRGLPLARRLRRDHRGILTVEVVDERYSLASMRHLAVVVRDAMAAYPSASVVFSPFDGFGGPLMVAARARSSEPPCPPIEVQLDGMPQVVSPGGPPPSSEEADSRGAAEALAARYGRMQLISAE